MKKLKEKLNAKLSKNGGFTLVEMLIVVAIIAILIAVSIPLVGSALENAREATDAANERSFKAALVSGYLLTEAKMNPSAADAVATGNLYAYDAVNGEVVTTGNAPSDGYGKSDNTGNNTTVVCKGKVLYGTIDANGNVFMKWDAGGTAVGSATGALDATSAPATGLISSGLMKETP